MAIPDVGVPKDGPYFAFWSSLAVQARVFGGAVLVLLWLIWRAIRSLGCS